MINNNKTETTMTNANIPNNAEWCEYAYGTYAWYSDGSWYNDFGQTLQNPAEYDNESEGYTPFGDE